MMSGVIKKCVPSVVLLCSLVLVICGVAIPRDTNAVEWGMDIDCAACHTHEAATLTNENSLLSTHSGMSCISCHSQEDKLATAHKNMSADVSKLRRLRRTAVSEDSCIACHGDWDRLSNLTKETTLIRDIEGRTVNPHIIMTELNVNKQHNRITCTSCHQMHTDHVQNADTKLEVVANGVCSTCHHAKVYTCGTCHD